VLFVTHSVEEAVFLSDRVVVLTRSPGRIKSIIDIDLPRPRRRAQLLVDRRYQQYVVDIEQLMDNPALSDPPPLAGEVGAPTGPREARPDDKLSAPGGG
jgi:NitT/TauT family transport system ATP-binding protein